MSQTHSLFDETVIEETEEYEPSSTTVTDSQVTTKAPLVEIHAPSLENLEKVDENSSSEATTGKHRSQLMKQRSLNGFLVSESQRGAMERQSSV